MCMLWHLEDYPMFGGVMHDFCCACSSCIYTCRVEDNLILSAWTCPVTRIRAHIYGGYMVVRGGGGALIRSGGLRNRDVDMERRRIEFLDRLFFFVFV